MLRLGIVINVGIGNIIFQTNSIGCVSKSQ